MRPPIRTSHLPKQRRPSFPNTSGTDPQQREGREEGEEGVSVGVSVGVGAQGGGGRVRGAPCPGGDAVVHLDKDALNAYLSMVDDWPDADPHFGTAADAQCLPRVAPGMGHPSPLMPVPSQQAASDLRPPPQPPSAGNLYQPSQHQHFAPHKLPAHSQRAWPAPSSLPTLSHARHQQHTQLQPQQPPFQGGQRDPSSPAAGDSLTFGGGVKSGSGRLGGGRTDHLRYPRPPKSVTFDFSQRENAPLSSPRFGAFGLGLRGAADDDGSKAAPGEEEEDEHPSQVPFAFSSQQSVQMQPQQNHHPLLAPPLWQHGTAAGGVSAGGARRDEYGAAVAEGGGGGGDGHTAGESDPLNLLYDSQQQTQTQGVCQASQQQQQQQQQVPRRLPTLQRKKKGSTRPSGGYSEGF